MTSRHAFTASTYHVELPQGEGKIEAPLLLVGKDEVPRVQVRNMGGEGFHSDYE